MENERVAADREFGLMDGRKKRLTDAVDLHQFSTDTNDVDNRMLDILKLVSRDDIGKDGSNVQTIFGGQVSPHLGNVIFPFFRLGTVAFWG